MQFLGPLCIVLVNSEEQDVKKAASTTLGRKPVFSKQLEQELVSYLVEMEALFFGLTIKDVSIMAAYWKLVITLLILLVQMAGLVRTGFTHLWKGIRTSYPLENRLGLPSQEQKVLIRKK